MTTPLNTTISRYVGAFMTGFMVVIAPTSAVGVQLNREVILGGVLAGLTAAWKLSVPAPVSAPEIGSTVTPGQIAQAIMDSPVNTTATIPAWNPPAPAPTTHQVPDMTPYIPNQPVVPAPS